MGPPSAKQRWGSIRGAGTLAILHWAASGPTRELWFYPIGLVVGFIIGYVLGLEARIVPLRRGDRNRRGSQGSKR